jgi:hypothetical protein
MFAAGGDTSESYAIERRNGGPASRVP